MSGERVLVVEDDPGILNYLGIVVGGMGYEVLQVQDGLEAFRLAEREPPDLIITDIGLPGIDGVELIKCLKADLHLRHIPIIAVTGGNRSEEAVAAGCSAVLRKPFDIGRLESAINSALI